VRSEKRPAWWLKCLDLGFSGLELLLVIRY